MAIGDDDQTIYGFRGASMRFFRSFAERYNATVYEMTDNFRCRAAQVLLANRVIAQNRERHPKTLVAARGFGGSTRLHRDRDPAAMGHTMVAQIRKRAGSRPRRQRDRRAGTAHRPDSAG
jgi:DNA helicase-2/ATP-dependent DNA helicase PcrA